MGTETIKGVEKEYDLKKFIAGKKIIKINETIKNINSKNVEEKKISIVRMLKKNLWVWMSINKLYIKLNIYF